MIRVDFRPRQQNHLTRALISLVVFITVISMLATPLAASAKELPYPAPILVAPTDSSRAIQSKPLIAGLAKNDSLIKVFIDGQLNGQFQIKNHASGTANFSYEPFLNLKPGWHEAYATATDARGKQSLRSNLLRFDVEYPMPAPILLEAVVNEKTTSARPWLTGLSKNDALIRIYIDGKDDGQFKVKNDQSGTADFSYRTYYDLKPGQHTAYAVAISQSGKESRYSNVLTFTVPAPAQVASPTDQGQPEVKGEETGTPTTGGDDASANTDTNNNTNATATGESKEEGGNWPVVIGLLILAVVLIIVIDSLVRRRRLPDSNTQASLFGPEAPPGGKDEKKPETPNQLFPPPPPDIK